MVTKVQTNNHQTLLITFYFPTFQTLLFYNNDAKHSWLSNSFFYPDEADGLSNKVEGGNKVPNNGLRDRHNATKSSKLFDIVARPYLDFFDVTRILVPCDLRLKLSRAPPSFYLMASSGKEYKIKIHSASWYIRQLKMASAYDMQVNLSIYLMQYIVVSS